MGARILWLLWLVTPALWADTVSYQRDIQPIFTAKCVVCHACYDAPCQLNLGSAAGLLRGATKVPVYDGTRTEAQAPTRLFIDALDESSWRRKGFYSVLTPKTAEGQPAALLERLLERGHQQVWPANERLPESLDISIQRTNACPVPGDWEKSLSENPLLGMPFAVNGLNDGEWRTLQRWLAQGAPVEEAPYQPRPEEQAQIDAWEALLNATGARQALVSRWLYEHLFLAHLYFSGLKTADGSAPPFFELVRSRTPSGQPVVPLTTRRPNDDPGPEFYYRLRPIQAVIVHKTHITYALNPEGLARIRQLFLGDDWSTDRVPGYGSSHQTNPFETFAAIPAPARYQFMLDNAEYFVRTFIRGPVCRGQIATDVIRDRFWVMFQHPEQDLYLRDPQYRIRATAFLALPGLVGGLSALPNQWTESRERRRAYAQLRQDAYAQAPAPDWSHLWRGNQDALLTVFRQHDSASVHQGLIGDLPQTLWLLDFPLLERIYYLLVVNFDVFGDVAHQAQTRLYFDLLRNGAEQNFLRLLPPEQRQAELDDWYQGSGRLKLWLDYPTLDRSTPTAFSLPASGAKASFLRSLLQQLEQTPAAPEDLNRCPRTSGCHRDALTGRLALAEQALSRLANKPARDFPLLLQLPEATIIRLEGPKGQRILYSLLRDRAHTNVAFMFGESYRYQPEQDSLTLYPGILTSYPNFLFNIPWDEVDDFVTALMRTPATKEDFRTLVKRWGVRRTHPQFWDYFNDLSRYLRETDPVEAGVLDMNRYENL